MAYTAIDRSRDHFVVTLWTGNDVDGRTISNGEFLPDFLWMFNRNNAGACPGVVYNSTIGAGTNSAAFGGNANGQYNAIFTSLNYELANGDFYRYGYLSGLTSTGFTCAAGNDGSGYQNYRHNQNNYNYVAWQWKANGGTTTSKSSGTVAGNVTTPCIQQVNTTSGFSIITYTASTSYAGSETHLEHGLGVGPEFVIVKSLDAAGGWAVYHAENGGSPNAGYSYNILDTNAATAQASPTNQYWLNTPAESNATLLAFGSNADVGANGTNYVAYCFAEKQGYSKFGKYQGNSDSTGKGPFVYTGFAPSWVMIKKTDSANDWVIHTYELGTIASTGSEKGNLGNANTAALRANENSAVDGWGSIDMLSNGFRVTSAGGASENVSAPYIYMAFAENPFVTSTGIPAVAR